MRYLWRAVYHEGEVLESFAAVHASVPSHFNQDRSLSSRTLFKQNHAAAFAEWRQICTA